MLEFSIEIDTSKLGELIKKNQESQLSSKTGYYLVNVTKGETKMGLCIKAIKNLSSYRMDAFVKTIQGGYTFVDHKRISRKKFDELRNFKKEKS